MSKIQKWHEARNTHEDLVARARTWCLTSDSEWGPLRSDPKYGVGIHYVVNDWIASRKAELYRDMIAFSSERLADAAREALAECEQIRADAARDVESIEEGE